MGLYGRREQSAAWSLVAAQLVLLAGLVFAPGARVWATPLWLVAALDQRRCRGVPVGRDCHLVPLM